MSEDQKQTEGSIHTMKQWKIIVMTTVKTWKGSEKCWSILQNPPALMFFIGKNHFSIIYIECFLFSLYLFPQKPTNNTRTLKTHLELRQKPKTHVKVPACFPNLQLWSPPCNHKFIMTQLIHYWFRSNIIQWFGNGLATNVYHIPQLCIYICFLQHVSLPSSCSFTTPRWMIMSCHVRTFCLSHWMNWIFRWI